MTSSSPSPLSFSFSPSTFRFSSSPLNSFYYDVLPVISLWLLIIYSIQYIQKSRGNPSPPKWFQWAFVFHNYLLSFMSLIMLIGVTQSVIRTFLSSSRPMDFAFRLVCETSPSFSTGELYFWSYIYYLSKYYELLDTVFLAVKGKLEGWGGLNVYHHALVLPMSYFWVSNGQSLQFIGMAFNCAVHVVMYAYFGIQSTPNGKEKEEKTKSIDGTPSSSSSPSRRHWLRPLITQFQIIQFITSFLCIIPNVYSYHILNIPCASQYTLYGNAVFNATLLADFIGIHKQTKRNSKKEKEK